MYDACDVERVYFSRWRAVLASADDDWGDPRVFGRRIWGAAERGLVVREKKVEHMKMRVDEDEACKMRIENTAKGRGLGGRASRHITSRGRADARSPLESFPRLQRVLALQHPAFAHGFCQGLMD